MRALLNNRLKDPNLIVITAPILRSEGSRFSEGGGGPHGLEWAIRVLGFRMCILTQKALKGQSSKIALPIGSLVVPFWTTLKGSTYKPQKRST